MLERLPGLAAYNLSGKTALITGAAGLLGSQHAAALAEIGAHVVLSDVNEAALHDKTVKLTALYGDKFSTCAIDVTAEDSIRHAADVIGIIDVLINNAAVDPKVSGDGVGTELSRLENFPIGEWERQISVGLTGAFLCSRIFGTTMAKGKGGVILNIASDLSIIAPDQRLYRKSHLSADQQPVKPVAYSVVKAGLVGLTRYLAGYWADKNIRVNAISPGGVFNEQPDEFVEKLTKLIPMGRMAEIGEYRAAVQFLCSPASSYMTGQNIILDGGRSIL